MPENHNKMMMMLAYIFLLSDKALSFLSEALEVVSTKESGGRSGWIPDNPFSLRMSLYQMKYPVTDPVKFGSKVKLWHISNPYLTI